MKKILTKEQKDKKDRRNQIVLGLILILVMVFSTIGFSVINSQNYNQDSAEYEYNGIKFVQSSGYWSFRVNGNDFFTLYNPSETRDVNITNSRVLSDYIGKPLYFDVNLTEGGLEIARNLNGFALRSQNACISGEECNSNAPIKDCSTDNIIVAREPKAGENERVYQQDNCVFIIASNDNQAKYADRLLFEMLGI